MDVACPVCNRTFKSSFINLHLDTCLDFPNTSKRIRDGEDTSEKVSPSSAKRVKNKTGICDDNDDPINENESSSFVDKHTSSPGSFLSAVGKETPSYNGVKNNYAKIKQFAPLAEEMRPDTLDEYSGQEKVIAKDCVLRKLIESNQIPSMIFWGPPGCGKTTLAHIIAKKTQGTYKFVKLSATTSGVKDVKEMVEIAKSSQRLLKKKTILFIDEIHRFNKLQQDVFLQHVENGTIILIGATTENPSFSLNSALLSRCQVVLLEKLAAENVEVILERALEKMNINFIDDQKNITEDLFQRQFIEKSAVKTLSELCDGDARFALNGLQMAVEYVNAMKNSTAGCQKQTIRVVTKEHISEGLKRLHLLYDRTGDQHYNCISAFIKSMRGSSENATLYWLARMVEGGEDPRFIARRMAVFASEDVGMADPNALNLAVSTMYACQNIGIPECRINLAHCAVYLARAPKSRESYEAYEKAVECIKNQKGPQPSVPLHLCNAPTRLMKDIGCGKGYKMYNTNSSSYMPDSLRHLNFFNNKMPPFCSSSNH